MTLPCYLRKEKVKKLSSPIKYKYMRIRTRTRGTNQYAVKGELLDYAVCQHCGGIVSTAEYVGSPFPIKKQITKCSRCGKSLSNKEGSK